MTESGKAGQARKGLIDSVKGKAKEMVGALTGNDSLTAEGELEQAQAQKRKEATRVEALADAEAAKAHAEANEAKAEGAAERSAVNAEAAAEETAIRTEQAAHKRATEQAAHQGLAKERAQAERDAQGETERAKAEERAGVRAADEEVVDSLDDHQDAVRESALARAEADRIKRQADSLSKDADLP
jgi:uncharacterized protein YjbJ (UPF0337 family)